MKRTWILESLDGFIFSNARLILYYIWSKTLCFVPLVCVALWRSVTLHYCMRSNANCDCSTSLQIITNSQFFLPCSDRSSLHYDVAHQTTQRNNYHISERTHGPRPNKSVLFCVTWNFVMLCVILWRAVTSCCHAIALRCKMQDKTNCQITAFPVLPCVTLFYNPDLSAVYFVAHCVLHCYLVIFDVTLCFIVISCDIWCYFVLLTHHRGKFSRSFLAASARNWALLAAGSTQPCK